MNDALDVISPRSFALDYRGERLELTPLTVAELRAFIDAAQPVMPALQLLANVEGAREVAVFSDVLLDFGEELAAFAAVGARRSKGWIQGEQSIPAFIALVGKVIEANIDFFHLAVQRHLRAAAAIANGTGPTPSSTSLATATASTPSADTPSSS
ncbi:hypothetical protein NB688_000587 [Xanthomonas sacchari]|uniref:Tail assembly chaperone n=1 Tax=Xanthomonas sacchari TaxID=56458 RepID=A0ABT3DTE1_9XANT|nr:hypothetical protein [Xanthomonas sacchari]MCW0398773.1 hypothetical protein [Xanthomonas sacchari]MCW0418421.1 hypothetical protein [Xanthomonas sacchari]UYK72516.1 hypothetical protein NG828_20405 [Xanthomonas sacchari]